LSIVCILWFDILFLSLFLSKISVDNKYKVSAV
jgi:hypothetical protein